MAFLLVTKAQARLLRRALGRAENYPLRGVVVGGPDTLSIDPPAVDDNDDLVETPGWTSEAIEPPLWSPDGDQACIDLPQVLERHLGKSFTVRGTTITLPPASALKTFAELPVKVQALLEARRNPSPETLL
jgi:hypothetical protein